jgi:superfamily II DNA or RNA helicase
MLVSMGGGYVVAPCGSGKTTIGIGCIAALNTRALVLTHTKDLAQQWIDRCRQQLTDEDGHPVEATMYGGGSFDDSGRVVVATFQTLVRMDFQERYDLGQEFGLLIADEAHHIPSATFTTVLNSMPARYRLGLTATPQRNDNLSPIMVFHLGLELKRINIQDLALRGLVLLPKVEWLHTGWWPEEDEDDWPILINKMTADEERNNAILGRVRQLAAGGRQVLVLSDRVAHCQLLAEALNSEGIEAAALVGKMTKKQRQAVLEAADAGEYRVVTATQLADEGLDLPGLEAVVLTTPTKAMGRIQQRVGRIMRTREGKQHPIIIDCVDGPGSFQGMAKRRQKFYKSLGLMAS